MFNDQEAIMKSLIFTILFTLSFSANAESTTWGCNTPKNVYGERNQNTEVRSLEKYKKAEASGTLDLVKCTFIFSSANEKLQIWFNATGAEFSTLLGYFTETISTLPGGEVSSVVMSEILSYSKEIKSGADLTFKYKLEPSK